MATMMRRNLIRIGVGLSAIVLGACGSEAATTEVVGPHGSVPAQADSSFVQCDAEQTPPIPAELPPDGHRVMEPRLAPDAPLLQGRETNEPQVHYVLYPAEPSEAVVSPEEVLAQARNDYKDLPTTVRLARVAAPQDESGLDGRVVWLVSFTMPEGTEQPALGPSVAKEGELPPPCKIGHVTGLVDAKSGEPLISFGTQ